MNCSRLAPRALSLALPLLFATAVANAAAVRGVVRTPRGPALPGARVTLAPPDTSQVFEARSGADGSYEFAGVTAGTWRIGASLTGRSYAETLRVVG